MDWVDGDWRRKVSRTVHPVEVPIVDADQRRSRRLVIPKSREAGGLGTRGRRRVGVQLTRELPLQRFDTLNREPGYAPENVDAPRRRVQHIGGGRQIATCADGREYTGPVLVGIKKHV